MADKPRTYPFLQRVMDWGMGSGHSREHFDADALQHSQNPGIMPLQLYANGMEGELGNHGTSEGPFAYIPSVPLAVVTNTVNDIGQGSDNSPIPSVLVGGA
jgi:hypothetical protein